MIELQGKFNTAKVFTDVVDNESISQVINLLNQEYISGSKIHMMPDIHAGAGCTIGTTMTIQGKICPNMVGVDIGCGMETVRIQEENVDLVKLDKHIRQHIPSGFSIHSRPLGLEIAKYYQEAGYKYLTSYSKEEIDRVIEELKSQGKQSEIQKALKSLTKYTSVPKALAYVEGELFEQCIYDMRIAQKFAELNRKAMMDTIVNGMGLSVIEEFTTIHNYIDIDNMILRKGAVSAQEGEKLVIPINMRDGSLVCVGKGNPDWNYSAPHGAGRLMSRSAAKEAFTVSEFEKQMEGIYTTSVGRSTLDECPMAYKNMLSDIVDNINPTAEIIAVVKPIYNFKASDGE